MLSVLVTLAVFAFLLFWLGVSYRRILRLRVLVSRAWKTLDEHVKRRIEIVGQTLEVARNAGIQGAEVDRLAHAHAQSVPYRGPSDAGRRNAQLDQALNGLLSLMGQHPGLGGALRAISEDLNAISRSVAGARDSYNDRAIGYNRAIGAVPGNLIAGLGGFHRAELFAG
jgi:LemA protein